MRRLFAVSMLLLSCLSCGPTYELGGTWRGTWTASMNGDVQGGAMTITIAAGSVSGGGTNTRYSTAFAVIGTVDAYGNGVLVYTYPGQSVYDVKCKARLLAGHLLGDCQISVGGTATGASTFDLTMTDAGLTDAGLMDAGLTDAGLTDAGMDTCRDTDKSPENLVVNPGFECGSASPSEWAGIYGSASFPSEGRSGRAAKLVADSRGGRLSYMLDLGVASATTYCARVWMRGTAPFMGVSLVTTSQIFSSIEQVSTSWRQVPCRAATAAGEKVSLLVEMQIARTDGMNAKPGDVMFVDDVDVWVSATARCDER